MAVGRAEGQAKPRFGAIVSREFRKQRLAVWVDQPAGRQRPF